MFATCLEGKNEKLGFGTATFGKENFAKTNLRDGPSRISWQEQRTQVLCAFLWFRKFDFKKGFCFQKALILIKLCFYLKESWVWGRPCNHLKLHCCEVGLSKLVEKQQFFFKKKVGFPQPTSQRCHTRCLRGLPHALLSWLTQDTFIQVFREKNNSMKKVHVFENFSWIFLSFFHFEYTNAFFVTL